MLGYALEFYQRDTGSFPTSEEGIQALIEPPEPLRRSAAYRSGGYLAGGKVPDDPWGYPYQYRYPGRENPSSFDLWSLGADGRSGGTGRDADISNWSPTGLAQHLDANRREGLVRFGVVGAASGAAIGLPLYALLAARSRRAGKSLREALGGPRIVALASLVVLFATLAAVLLSAITRSAA
jgi:general secretion pathway protein G